MPCGEAIWRRPRQIVSSLESGDLLLDGARIRRRRRLHFDLAGLHGLGNTALQIDMQHSVFEPGVLRLDEIRQVEPPLKRGASDAAIEIFGLRLVFRLLISAEI